MFERSHPRLSPATAGVERGRGDRRGLQRQKNKNAANHSAKRPNQIHAARKACLSSCPSSGLSANGSVGLRPSITSSIRVCTVASALAWL